MFGNLKADEKFIDRLRDLGNGCRGTVSFRVGADGLVKRAEQLIDNLPGLVKAFRFFPVVGIRIIAPGAVALPSAAVDSISKAVVFQTVDPIFRTREKISFQTAEEGLISPLFLHRFNRR